MTAGTNFPTSLDSHTSASPLGFGEVNNQAYTLSTAAHSNSVTTITVASTSAFPSKGYLVIKREIVSYTGTTATTFTGVTRGVGGTTAAAFGSGTLVEQVPVAANHNDLAAAIVAIETKIGTGSSTPIAASLLRGTGTGGSAWDSTPVCYLVDTNLTVSIANLTTTPITFNSEVHDPDGLHSTSSNTERITIGKDGYYVVVASVYMDAAASGYSQLTITYNDGSDHLISFNRVPNSTVGAAFTTSTAPIFLAVGNYVWCSVRQSSGGALNMLGSGGGANPYAPVLGLWRVN